MKSVRYTNAVVPDVTYARLKYVKGGYLQISNSTLSTNSGLSQPVYLNDPFDPDPDVANASAQGFDYFRDYYSQYFVASCTVIVEFSNLGESANGKYGCVGYVLPQFGSPFPSVLSTTPVNYIQNIPRIKWKRMSGPFAGRQNTRIKTSWSVKEDQGAPTGRGNFWEGTSWGAFTNASPAIRRPLHIILGTENGAGNLAADAITAQYKVTVIYNCRFYTRKNTPELEDPE